MSEAPSRPSGVRHLIILLLTLMSVLLYLDRFCVSFAGDYIKEDLGLSQTQMSWFLSLFFWSYALSQVPAGWLADRFGARLMLSIYVVAWSLFTAQMGLVAGFTMLMVARLMCGITQAGAYPTAGGVISRWVPLSKRATASAWVGLGGRLGGAMAPILTPFLMIVFVPVGTSVEFTDTDMLSAPKLAARLTPISETLQQAIEIAAKENSQNQSAADLATTLKKKLTSEAPAAGKHLSKFAYQEMTSVVAGDVALAAEELRRLELQAAVDDVRKSAGVSPGEATRETPAPSSTSTPRSASIAVAELSEFLRTALNGLLNRRDLFDEAVFARVKLEREAVTYAKRQANAASDAPQKRGWLERTWNLCFRREIDKPLTGDEQRRFNRLLIEGAFPGEIRKLYGRGWRPVMIAYGLSGVIVAIGIWMMFRERPEQHSQVNDAERALIESGRLATAADPASKAGRLPIRPLFTNFSLWCNCANQIGTNIGWVFLVTWLSRYFIEMHNVPILERGVLVMMPNLIGMCGGFLGGRWVDWLLPRIGLKWSRSLPPIITRFIAAGGYGMCLYFASQPVGSALNSPWAFTAAFCLIYFSVDLGQSAFWAYAQDAGGKYVGSVLGWGNMWGNLGAAFGPLLYNHLLGENPTAAEWNNLFWLGLIAFVFAGVATFGLDASKPVFVEETG